VVGTTESQTVDPESPVDSSISIGQCLGFRGSERFREQYFDFVARFTRRPRREVVEEAKIATCRGTQTCSRWGFMPAEIVVYTLPVLRTCIRYDKLPAFNGMSVEPFYVAFRLINAELPSLGLPRARQPVYHHITAHVDPGQVDGSLLARSILPMLSEDEADSPASGEEWKEMADIVNSNDALRRTVEAQIPKSGRIAGLASHRKGEIVGILGDVGVDPHLLRFLSMAKSTMFGRALMDDDAGPRLNSRSVALVLERLRFRNSRLVQPLNEDEMSAIEDALRRLGSHVSRHVRNGAHKYIIAFGDIPRACIVKGRLKRRSLGVLYPLLRTTELGRSIASAPGGVLLVDQTVTSGSTMLVWHAVLKSFLPDLNVEYFSITQHDEYLADYLKASGFIEQVSRCGVWPMENCLDFCTGAFLKKGRFVSYDEIGKQLWSRHRGVGGAIDTDGLRCQIRRCDQSLDACIAKNAGEFSFVDSFESLRYSLATVKRQILKALIRNDPLQWMILKRDYLLRVSLEEEDFLGAFEVNDRIAALRNRTRHLVPAHVGPQERAIRFADQYIEVTKYIRNSQRMVGEIEKAMEQLLGHERMRCAIRDYLSGARPFADVERDFYQSI